MRILFLIFLSLSLSAPIYAQNFSHSFIKRTHQTLKQQAKSGSKAALSTGKKILLHSKTQVFNPSPLRVSAKQGALSFPQANGVWKELWKDPPHFLEEKDFFQDNDPLSDFNITLSRIKALKAKYNIYHAERSLYHMLEHSEHNTPFANKNNKLVLQALINHIQRIKWLNSYPHKGRSALQSTAGGNPIIQLAAHLKKEKMIFLGEYHFNPEIQQFVSGLILALKAQNPKRRVVVFTEFLPLTPRKLPDGQTVETYYRHVNQENIPPITGMDISSYTYASDTFNQLLKNRVEIYPLEDKQHVKLMAQEYDSELYELPLSVSMRNKTWARIIENKMAQIRQTDPDALFVVYAGLGHVSWIYPYALPKFFAKEKPAAVSLILKQHLKLHFLTNIWGPQDSFFTSPRTNTVFYWGGPDARQLAQHTGFDYMVALPKNNWERFKQFFNELAALLD